MTPEALSASEPQPKGMSAVSRLIGVFFEPTKTFEDIAARPGWVLPMVLVIVLGIVVTTLFTQRVGWERMMNQQFEMSSQAQQMTPEQRAQAIQFWAKLGPVIGYVGSIIGTPLIFLILSGVFLGMVKGIMSAPVSFKQVFAAVAHGWMPMAAASVLTIVVMLLKNPDDFRLENPLVFNPGAFLDPVSSNKFVLSVATSLDLFSLWAMVLMGLGLKAAGGKKLSTGGAMTAVFLPWAVYVLCKSALAGLRG